MNRRTLLSTLAGFFVGKKVVEAKPFRTAFPLGSYYWPPVLDEIKGIEGPIGETGPVGPVGMPGLRGPSADGQNETEAEHAQRWADAEEWNRKFERNNV